MPADTITKVLKEADDKLKKAEAAESKAIAVQKDATRLRDEADGKLRQVEAERHGLNHAKAEWEADSRRKEDDLKNREKTLTAKQKDLETKVTNNEEEFKNREAMIEARLAAVQKAERENKERKALLDDLDRKHKSISNFIQQTL